MIWIVGATALVAGLLAGLTGIGGALVAAVAWTLIGVGLWFGLNSLAPR